MMSRFFQTILILLITWPVFAGQLSQTEKSGTGSISGTVKSDGHPVPGAQVLLYTQPHIREPIRTVTNQNGHYQLKSIGDGEYDVVVFASGYVSEGENSQDSKAIKVVNGQTVDGIDFKLVKGGVITGRVTNAAGRPLSGQAPILRAMDKDGKSIPTDLPYLSEFVTDDRGIYRIYGIPSGRYVVGFRSDSRNSIATNGKQYPLMFYPGVSSEERAKSVEVSAGNEITDIDINFAEKEPGFTVSGRIVYASSGEGAPNVEFEYGKGDGKKDVPTTPLRTNDDGTFKIEGLPPGKYFVGANRRGGAVYGDNVSFEITDGDFNGLLVRVNRGAVITGTVVIEGIEDRKAAATLQDIDIQVSQTIVLPDGSTQGMMLSGRVKPDHSFRIEGIRGGKLSFSPDVTFAASKLSIRTIDIPGIARLVDDSGNPYRFFDDHEIEIKEGQNLDGVKIGLIVTDGVVEGQVKFEGDTFPEGTTVTAYITRLDVPEPTEIIGSTISDNGQFVIENLAPGQYRVRIAKEEPLEASSRTIVDVSKTVFVQNGQVTRVSLVLNLAKKPENGNK